MRIKLFVSLLIDFSLLFTLLSPTRAFAQSENPPVDPAGAWSEVVNADGSINYSNLTDGGVVTQEADWMPNIPLVGPVEAEYHVYYTPSGNTILMPTATTLFFMAANPSESGYLAAASTLGTGGQSVGADAPNGIAGIGSVFGALLDNDGSEQMMAAIQQAGFSGPTAAEDFFAALANGQTDIWSLGPVGLTNFLGSLLEASQADQSLYTYMLLYTPDQCASVPGGCTPEQLALLETLLPEPPTEEELPPAPGTCPGPSVTPGRIVKSARLVAPDYPLVVGQDPDKRGADIMASAHVEPTIYTYYTSEPVTECSEGASKNGTTNCTTDSGKPGHEKVVDWECVQHQKIYPECISFASATLKLTAESQGWILNELSIRYPGAYLHNPRIAFGSSNGCQWNETYPSVQIEDPGTWDIFINGQTSGTPVSAPRPFGGKSGEVGAWLRETAIIK